MAKIVNIFAKKAPSLMFDWALSTPLLIRIFEALQRQVKKNWTQQIKFMEVWGRTGLTHISQVLHYKTNDWAKMG